MKDAKKLYHFFNLKEIPTQQDLILPYNIIKNKHLDKKVALALYSFLYTAFFTNVSKNMNTTGGLTSKQYTQSKNRTRIEKILLAEIARENLERFSSKRKYVHYIRLFKALNLINYNNHIFKQETHEIYKNRCRQYIIVSAKNLLLKYDEFCKSIPNDDRTPSFTEFSEQTFFFTLSHEEVTQTYKNYLKRVVKHYDTKHKKLLNYDKIKLHNHASNARKYLLLKHVNKILDPKTTDYNEYIETIHNSENSIKTQEHHIQNIETNNVITIRDQFGHRYHNTYTQLDKGVRHYLNDGENKYVELDIQKSQLACIVPLIKSQLSLHDKKREFIDYIKSGLVGEQINKNGLKTLKQRDPQRHAYILNGLKLYKKIPAPNFPNFLDNVTKELETYTSLIQDNTILKVLHSEVESRLGQLIDTNLIKTLTFAILYSKINFFNKPSDFETLYKSDLNIIEEHSLSQLNYIAIKTNLFMAFKGMFPSILMCLTSYKKGGYKDLVKALQRIESSMMKDVLSSLNKKGLSYTPIHDAVLVNHKDAALIKPLVDQILSNHKIPTFCNLKQTSVSPIRTQLSHLKDTYKNNKTCQMDQNSDFKMNLTFDPITGEIINDIKNVSLNSRFIDPLKEQSNDCLNNGLSCPTNVGHRNSSLRSEFLLFLLNNKIKGLKLTSLIIPKITGFINSLKNIKIDGLMINKINLLIVNEVKKIIQNYRLNRFIKNNKKSGKIERKSCSTENRKQKKNKSENLFIYQLVKPILIGYNYMKKALKTSNVNQVSILRPETINTS